MTRNRIPSALVLFTALVAPFVAACDKGSSGDDGDDVVEDGDDDANDDTNDDGPSGACQGTELSCDGDSVQYCEDGEMQTASCDDLCGEMGYTSSGCDPQRGCNCDGIVDQECGTGASAMCTCFEWAGGDPCTDDAWLLMYDSCFAGTDETPRCVEDYVVNGTVDCEAAYACIG